MLPITFNLPPDEHARLLKLISDSDSSVSAYMRAITIGHLKKRGR